MASQGLRKLVIIHIFHSPQSRDSLTGRVSRQRKDFAIKAMTLRRKFRTIRNAFSTRYPNVMFGWSYKTNYLKAICAILHQEGAIAELVSKMEYDKAKALGIPGNQIILNGPHKPLATLEAAVRDGVTINIDHLDEIHAGSRGDRHPPQLGYSSGYPTQSRCWNSTLLIALWLQSRIGSGNGRDPAHCQWR